MHLRALSPSPRLTGGARLRPAPAPAHNTLPRFLLSPRSLHFAVRNPTFFRSRILNSSESQESQLELLDELELLDKPSPPPPPPEPSSPPPPPITTAVAPPEPASKLQDAIAPFVKLFQTSSTHEQNPAAPAAEPELLVPGFHYEPKQGDFAVGVVVSGNENRLDVSIGADALGTMLTKEMLPLYKDELPALLRDVGAAAEELKPGTIGIVRDEEAMAGSESGMGRPVVEPGTVVFTEVLGRTLSGRPLLSARKLFRRLAWHRVRQIQQLNQPIEVMIFEWNTSGLLTRIEGLRAFLPKVELMGRTNNFSDLKNNVGRKIYVCISKIDEATNYLIISEKDAWEMMHLKEGTLLQGTVRKIFPYGAQIRICQTNRSGLLHVSNISRARVDSVSDVLKVDDELKVLVIKSAAPDKISLSTAELESKPGLFLSDRQRVFAEAEVMVRKYRERLPVVSSPDMSQLSVPGLPFDDESLLYANWRWFRFERTSEPTPDSSS